MAQRSKSISERARRTIGDAITDNTYRNAEDAGRHAFVTPAALQEIWTDERLADVFAGVDPIRVPTCTSIRNSYLKIMSVLVVIEWAEWSQFKAIFIDQDAKTDSDLPLNELDLRGRHLSKNQVQNFLETQSKFLPATFYEHEDKDYKSEFRMPFSDKPQVISEKGAYCSVEEVNVVGGHYHDRCGEPNERVSLRKLPLPSSL